MKNNKDDLDKNLISAYWDKYTVKHECCREISIYNNNSNISGEDTCANNIPHIKKLNFKLKPKHIIIISAVCLLIAIYNFTTHHSFIPFLITAVILGCYGYHMLVVKDIEKQNEELDRVRQNMQDLKNPNRMYERLGVDILSLSIGQGLLEIADPDKDGELLGKIAGLRQRLTDTLGYVIPRIRILDSLELEQNEYAIKVRGNLAASGVVYPKKYMVNATQWEDAGFSTPKNTIVSYSPLDGEKVYWLNEKEIKNKDISYISTDEVIIEHIRKCCIKCINKIMEKTDILKMMEIVKTKDPTLINDLVPLFISAIDLKTIFCNLISRGISIKDINYIFEVLNDQARYTSDINKLTNILIEELTGLNLR